MHRHLLLANRLILVSCLALTLFAVLAQTDSPARERESALALFNDGNWNDAYDAFRKLVLQVDATTVGDVGMALACLQRLGRIDEFDEFLEAAAAVHVGNWRMLQEIGNQYYQAPHHGLMIAGAFHRGGHRGGGRWVDASTRDRVRALQLLEQARKLALDDAQAGGMELGTLFQRYAEFMLGYSGYSEAWRLQILTDLAQLPDYDEGRGRFGGGGRGAPVDAAGNPVFHSLPASFEVAENDGQRWRWLQMQAVEYYPLLRAGNLARFAQFLRHQFGVQTLRDQAWFFGMDMAEDDDSRGGVYTLHTLAENETLARLATGVKRFELPDEFNFIAIYRQLIDLGREGEAHRPWEQLAIIFTDRRQYPKAAEAWRQAITAYGDNGSRRKALDQIVGNWLRFEPIGVNATGVSPDVDIVYRNGEQIAFKAYEIKFETLLADVKNYLKSKPERLDGHQIGVDNIGYRLVQENQRKYRGEKVAEWSLPVDPAADHVDRRVTVPIPLKRPGAYLVEATIKDGNTSRIVIWIADTALVEKNLDGRKLYYLADAETGRPIPQATLEFFGYRQQWRRKGAANELHLEISQFAEFTNENGLAIPDAKDLQSNYHWLVTATTEGGRFAYLGFSGVWYGRRHDAEYNQRKVYVITDRPVYRPEHEVQFKLWVRHAQYDTDDVSQFAGHAFTLRIHDPRGDKVFERRYTADAYGGFEGTYSLPAAATLGTYRLDIPGMGGGTFRVEEYKKPEFEVTVEAPSEPVRLGETVTATIAATYYFGSPVAHGVAKIKVERYAHSANWYPVAPWDWFYGPGYWWFAYDYPWYPGWRDWCIPAPRWWWFPSAQTPPELVVDLEREIGPDGRLEIEIDTAAAKELHGHTDHRYQLTVEVTDQSRRTIVGSGQVLVARQPFKVYTWVDRGHYRQGDTIRASFQAQTLDHRPVQGRGKLVLYSLAYDADGKPLETPQQEWNLDTDEQGAAQRQLTASRPGQYRLSYTVTDSRGNDIEGAYIFIVAGEGFDGREFRFNQIELVPDKRDYAPGETVELRVNTERAGSTVLLFIRPANGVYLPPKVLRLPGKSVVETIQVSKKDMPNFFVEAVTISDGKVHVATREIIVPPEKRVLTVDILPSKTDYLPGEEATVEVRLTDFFGEPFKGSLTMSVYDKALEYISGGGNVSEIRDFFWKWRRGHQPHTRHSLMARFNELLKQGEIAMAGLGVFGGVWDADADLDEMAFGMARKGMTRGVRAVGFAGGDMVVAEAMPMAAPAAMANGMGDLAMARVDTTVGGEAGEGHAATEIRSEFADTAFWRGTLATDDQGRATVSFTMPENLTGWSVKTWAMGHGTKVGQGDAPVVTRKNVIVRLQAPRFFVEKDEVVLSANIHNYLDAEQEIAAVLELSGLELIPLDTAVTVLANPALPHRRVVEAVDLLRAAGVAEVSLATTESEGLTLRSTKNVTLAAGGEARVDWRVKVAREGEAVVRMKALGPVESDAMEMRFPVYVHGMDKMVSFSGVIRPEGREGVVVIDVPEQRRVNESRLEVNYSPTLAGAMVDALPYLVDYPYGCTEQTLNRFVPTVIVQKILLDMGLDLEAIRDRRSTLNAQELGDPDERAAQWRQGRRNPVFDIDEVQRMVREGVKRLTAMQNADGGWGWFSGWGERSFPHTTAVVVHGLRKARENDVALVPGVLENGVEWLKRYQAEQVRYLENAEKERKNQRWKAAADNLDALIYMILAESGHDNSAMQTYLYRDRNGLAVYGKAAFGIGLHQVGEGEKLAMVLRNIEQYLVEDEENQTAYLRLPNQSYWWHWYGGETEAHAFYLKLLARTEATSEKAAGLVKYLLNNRKHASYWNSTRDTAFCIEAIAEYLQASGEDKPNMTVDIVVDGRTMRQVRITAETLFQFDSRFELFGDAIESGQQEIKLVKRGTGPLYYNAYLSYFTLEDFIEKAGLEVKVERQVYKLIPDEDATAMAAGSRGQALAQRVLTYRRQPLASGDTVKSGDLVEVELVIESKNDYEYIIVEDMKAAGFEPVDLRSGYTGNEMGAYVEFRDERVAFFIRALARGKHSVSYRLRAEIPGAFSALPTRISAMYAPELRGNSDEIKLAIED